MLSCCMENEYLDEVCKLRTRRDNQKWPNMFNFTDNHLRIHYGRADFSAQSDQIFFTAKNDQIQVDQSSAYQIRFWCFLSPVSGFLVKAFPLMYPGHLTGLNPLIRFQAGVGTFQQLGFFSF